MSFLLGIDMGTTSVKCVLFNQNGHFIGFGKKEYSLSTPKPDFVEVKPETYWESFKIALSTVINQTKISPAAINGIGISSQGETFIPLGYNGKPLRDAIVWLDNRSLKEAELIKQEFGEDLVYKITGQNEVVPTWTATKILWLKNNEPEVFKKTQKYLLLEDYMIYRLTEKYATEHSIVCSSLLFNISKKKWWNDILDYIGINEDQLPELHHPGSPIGNISSETEKETSLNVNCLVATGAYDQAANAIGVGNIDSGVASETTGGSLAVVATTDKLTLDPKRRLPCHIHAVKGKFFLQPWCPTAGAVLKWYKDRFSITEIEVAKKLGLDPYDLLTFEAKSIPAGSEGLILLPHFAGAASPEFNPEAKGVLFGLTLSHGRAHIIRAIMESIAYMIRRNLDLLKELRVEVNEIRSTGGGARSSLWNQIKSDVIHKPVITVNSEETGALGVAILAGLATNIFSSIENACKSMIQTRDRIFPSEENREVYDKAFKKYVKLYSKLETLF
jgi:xylulokinase